MRHANSWYEYINQLHHHIRQQDNRIQELEQRLEQMETNTTKGNHTTIERLEYHFDQLKIERLDGTLHIGLSPEELANTDDLSLNQQTNPTEQEVVRQLDTYLTEHGPALLHQLSHEYGYPDNQSNQEMLLDDVRKQLPERVSYYQKQAKDDRVNQSDAALSHYLFEQVQKEINYSLRQFFENKPSKGDQEA